MTTPDARHRIKAIFEEASDLRPEDRAERLAAERDPALRAAVERLLAAETALADDAFLEAGPFSVLALLPAEEEERADPLPGSRLGPYRIVSRIGAGGTGVVYLAAREDDFRLRAAIKVARHGGEAAAVDRLLRRERQTLALLDHPGICRLLDGGTVAGRPYLVMELVEGIPLLEHAEREGLDVAARLALLERVADAVASAHAVGIVHGDLKSANVLVDAEAAPKVLDFGVGGLFGRAMEAFPESAGVPRFVSPHCASPEQAEGTAIGPPTDVYALGLLGYHLVVGAPAFDVAGLDWPTIVERIVQQRPRSPRLAARRRTDAPRPLRDDRMRELDRILLKALEKDPRDRYVDAAALRDDLVRLREERPVEAVRATPLYRARKLARRHPTETRLAALAILLLAAALAVATLGWIRAVTEGHDRVLATEARASVETERRTLQRVDRSKRLALAALAGLGGSPEEDLRLAFEAIHQAETTAAEYALRALLLRDRPVVLLRGHERPVRSIALSPDADLAATVASDGTARCWRVADGAEIARCDAGVPLGAVAFIARASRLAAGGDDGRLRIWDVATGRAVGSAEANGPPILEIVVHDPSRRVATIDEAGIRVFVVDQAGEPRPLPVREPTLVRGARGLGLARSGTFAAVGAGEAPGDLHLFGIADDSAPPRVFAGQGPVRDLAFRDDDAVIAVAQDDGTVRIRDVATGAVVAVLTDGAAAVHRVAFGERGAWVATASADARVRVFDVADGRLVRRVAGRDVAISADGRLLAVAGPGTDASVASWKLYGPLAMVIRAAAARGATRLDPAELERAEGVARGARDVLLERLTEELARDAEAEARRRAGATDAAP